jgi:hypothetical protein
MRVCGEGRCAADSLGFFLTGQKAAQAGGRTKQNPDTGVRRDSVNDHKDAVNSAKTAGSCLVLLTLTDLPTNREI